MWRFNAGVAVCDTFLYLITYKLGGIAMKKATVIGIAGGSASGKSTFAKQLIEMLQGIEVLTLHMDSYFKPEEELPLAEAPITGKTYRDYLLNVGLMSVLSDS